MVDNRYTARQSPIELPAVQDLGPAMRELSEPQRRFVLAMVEMGTDNYTAAARVAGYGGTDGATLVAAHRLSHNPAVQAAIREEADRRLRAGAILAASALIEIVADKSHKDRFKAADRLLERAGMLVENINRTIVEDHRTDKEIEQAIILMARRNGLDPQKLLGRPLAPIEGEFEEVGSAEGIEDLLA